ncbi:hypothetical protein ACFU9Y_22670 [Streptomyces sp. NPDC057621]|uniref:hypothetical protein n=1 Tax=Streptomyces sp. NPDC057621 TaxID=3346186 RepID=UPI0036A5E248
MSGFRRSRFTVDAGRLFTRFGPLLAAVRQLRPTGSLDPRAADRLVPLKRNVTLREKDLLQLAAAAGPLEAAALTAAEDGGADATVLYCIVEAGPVAWTGDFPAVLAALAGTDLRAFCLAAASAAHCPGAVPAGPAGSGRSRTAATARGAAPRGHAR